MVGYIYVNNFKLPDGTYLKDRKETFYEIKKSESYILNDLRELFIFKKKTSINYERFCINASSLFFKISYDEKRSTIKGEEYILGTFKIIKSVSLYDLFDILIESINSEKDVGTQVYKNQRELFDVIFNSPQVDKIFIDKVLKTLLKAKKSSDTETILEKIINSKFINETNIIDVINAIKDTKNLFLLISKYSEVINITLFNAIVNKINNTEGTIGYNGIEEFLNLSDKYNFKISNYILKELFLKAEGEANILKFLLKYGSEIDNSCLFSIVKSLIPKKDFLRNGIILHGSKLREEGIELIIKEILFKHKDKIDEEIINLIIGEYKYDDKIRAIVTEFFFDNPKPMLNILISQNKDAINSMIYFICNGVVSNEGLINKFMLMISKPQFLCFLNAVLKSDKGSKIFNIIYDGLLKSNISEFDDNNLISIISKFIGLGEEEKLNHILSLLEQDKLDSLKKSLPITNDYALDESSIAERFFVEKAFINSKVINQGDDSEMPKISFEKEYFKFLVSMLSDERYLIKKLVIEEIYKECLPECIKENFYDSSFSSVCGRKMKMCGLFHGAKRGNNKK